MFNSDAQRSGSFSLIAEGASSNSRFLYCGHGNLKLAFRHCNSDGTNLQKSLALESTKILFVTCFFLKGTDCDKLLYSNFLFLLEVEPLDLSVSLGLDK